MKIVTAEDQIARRRKKAGKELRSVENLGEHPVFSSFRVVSETRREYTVRIRSVDSLINSCSCPDYSSNTIGTCKHIEGVLLHLRKTLAGFAELSSSPPRICELYLHRGEHASIRMTPADPELVAALGKGFLRHFGCDGEMVGAVVPVFRTVMGKIDGLPSALRERIFIHPDVTAFVESIEHTEDIDRQKKWFLSQLASGNRSLSLLRTELYPFQEDGVLHLAFGGRAMLADDMGLGKTVQAIAAVSLLQELRDIKRVLVVCPASLKHQWEREIRRFTSLPVSVIAGPPVLRETHYRKPAFFNIINYELVRRDADAMQIMQPDVIILDEAQRIKNWRTKTADAVKRLKSRYAFVLTGTPLENRLDELYSVFQFIDPSVLGPLWRFNQRYFRVEQRPSGSYKVLGYRNMKELRERIGPHVLRRTRDQVLSDLPPRTDNNYFVEMTTAQKKPYEEYRETVARILAIMNKRPLTPKEHDIVLRALQKMRMLCDALALHVKDMPWKDVESSSPKLRELKKIIEDEVLDGGKKAVIFSQWTTMLALAEKALSQMGVGSVTLSGAVPSAKRGALIDRFFNDENCRVFFSSDAGGTGLNLQAANLVINLDLPWNPAVLEQRIARAHRHGQKNAVQVINLIAQDTIEEKMLDTLGAKRDVFQGVFGTDESVDSIDFSDTGQQVVKQLQEILDDEKKQTEAETETSFAAEKGPSWAEPEPRAKKAGESHETAGRKPFHSELVRAFMAEMIEAHQSRLLQIIGYTPAFPQGSKAKRIMVVVDSDAGEIKPDAERILKRCFPEGRRPALDVLDRNGYEALISILGGDIEKMYSEATIAGHYDEDTVSPREELKKKLIKVRSGFEQAERKIELAEVLIKGGFPGEAVKPVGAALAWAVSSIVAINGKSEPGDSLPSSATINASLVEKGLLTRAMAGEIAFVRDLTNSSDPAEEEDNPPSQRTLKHMIQTVSSLVTAGREMIISKSL